MNKNKQNSFLEIHLVCCILNLCVPVGQFLAWAGLLFKKKKKVGIFSLYKLLVSFHALQVKLSHKGICF